MDTKSIRLKVGPTLSKLSRNLPPQIFTQIFEELMSPEKNAEIAFSTGINEETIEGYRKGHPINLDEKEQILLYAFRRYQDVTDIIYDFIFEIEDSLRKLSQSWIADDVVELQKKLDPTSRLILDYFLKNKSAGIRELSDLIRAESDHEVLMVIREVINAQAQEILGYPLLQFKRSYIDPMTGSKLLFRWWISEEVMELYEDVALIDIYKENDELQVIVSPLSTMEDVVIEGDFLVLKGRNYRNMVPLFYSVDSEISRTWNNNVLDIRLKLRDD